MKSSWVYWENVLCLKLYTQKLRWCVSVCHITWYNWVLLDDLVWHILIISKEFPLWGTCWQASKWSECYDRWLFISFLISGIELMVYSRFNMCNGTFQTSSLDKYLSWHFLNLLQICLLPNTPTSEIRRGTSTNRGTAPKWHTELIEFVIEE